MRRSLFLLPFLLLGFAGRADAVPFQIFVEIKTSTEFLDATAVVDFMPDLGDPFFGLELSDLDLTHPGLGAARIHAGAPITRYRHTFAPALPVGEVLRARVFVLVEDLDDRRERVGVSVNGTLRRQGQVDGFRLFTLGVRGRIQDSGDFVRMAVETLPGPQGRRGDFKLIGSALVVKYRTGDPTVPEPTSAVVFAVGILIVGRAARRS